MIPVPPLPDPNAISNQMTPIINNALPGFNNLSTSASSIVGNLMRGLPSPSTTQRANAYFGINSGMPGSDFVRNRGFDLYRQEANQYQQRGFDDFLKLLSGESGTVFTTPGQQQQNAQFGQDQQLRAEEVNAGIRLNNARLSQMESPEDQPWSSDNQGNVYSRSGKRLRYDKQFDIANSPGNHLNML